MNSEDEAKKDLEKNAEVFRTLIRQENDLTNHRTTWLLVTQGILFGAASALINQHWLLTIVVGLFGIMTALSIGHALENSFQGRQYLKNRWRKLVTEKGHKWEDFPPLDGGNPEQRPIKFLFPWKFIPRAIIVAWGIFIYYTMLKQ